MIWTSEFLKELGKTKFLGSLKRFFLMNHSAIEFQLLNTASPLSSFHLTSFPQAFLTTNSKFKLHFLLNICNPQDISRFAGNRRLSVSLSNPQVFQRKIYIFLLWKMKKFDGKAPSPKCPQLENVKSHPKVACGKDHVMHCRIVCPP